MRLAVLAAAALPLVALAQVSPERGAPPTPAGETAPGAGVAPVAEVAAPVPAGSAAPLPPGAVEPVSPGGTVVPPAPVSASLSRWGVRLDAGLPDGAMLAVLYRPTAGLRLHAGPTWNYLGWGYQLGVGFMPIRWAISPTFNVDYGHYFNTDATFIADRAGGSLPSGIRPLLESVGYDYFNFQLGLEFGSPSGGGFFIRAGLCYVTTTIHGASNSVSASSGGTTSVVELQDPTFRATIPSVQTGFLFYFF